MGWKNFDGNIMKMAWRHYIKVWTNLSSPHLLTTKLSYQCFLSHMLCLLYLETVGQVALK